MTCPICSGKSAAEYRPFCSKRCADVDLAKWLGGAYAIPSASEDPEDAEELAREMEREAVRQADPASRSRKPH